MQHDPRHRPFYDEYAWAYDLIIPAPTSAQIDFIHTKLNDRGCPPGSHLLDAGCGTGRYAVELARRGYIVRGIDTSAQFVDIARGRMKGNALPVSFTIANILELSRAVQYDAIFCRGVLNDLVDEGDRGSVFYSFARALRKPGALILDVRDWELSAPRKSQERVVEKQIQTPRGTLTFRSETELDEASHQLLVTEHHVLKSGKREIESSFDFRMRCWTANELEGALLNAGLREIEFFRGYDVRAAATSADRLVCVSQLPQASEIASS